MEIGKKIETLLNHWIEHNREHAAEYEKWAIKAKETGLNDVSRALLEAKEEIKKSSEKLRNALEHIKRIR